MRAAPPPRAQGKVAVRPCGPAEALPILRPSRRRYNAYNYTDPYNYTDAGWDNNYNYTDEWGGEEGESWWSRQENDPDWWRSDPNYNYTAESAWSNAWDNCNCPAYCSANGWRYEGESLLPEGEPVGWKPRSGCACSGYKNKHGFGQSCKGWEYVGQQPWCYVDANCSAAAHKGSFGESYDECDPVYNP